MKEDYQKGNMINYSTSICLFEPGKCGKEGKKLQKFEYLENEKSFLDEIKNLIKNSGHKVWFRYCNKFI